MTRRQYALDLTRCHARHTRGDIAVWLTWFGDDLTPCLVLTPTHREGYFTPCIILQRDAWKWSEAIGDGAHCARTSAIFSQILGMSHDVRSAMRVTSIIRDHLGDLLSIPPAPFETVVVADVIRTDVDGKVHHSEVTDRV